jgi:hypothetical protein
MSQVTKSQADSKYNYFTGIHYEFIHEKFFIKIEEADLSAFYTDINIYICHNIICHKYRCVACVYMYICVYLAFSYDVNISTTTQNYCNIDLQDFSLKRTILKHTDLESVIYG